MKLTTNPTAGIRTGNFSNTVLFLTQVLNLEMVHFDKENEFAQFKLSSGNTMEVLGSKNIWHPFTAPPDWEMIVADIRHTKEKSNRV